MTAIVLENVDVNFPIYSSHRSLRKVLLERATGGVIRHDEKSSTRVTINALVSVSLELKDGDRLGLVGHNGAGKSTLLRTMAGVYEPARGRIYVQGTTTPLFDTLPGMDPDDTGYENVVTAGMLFGMTRAEIRNKTPEIEEFSELGEYLSLPLRTYSTGMITRLGFALATAIDPGLLLIDEGIGAGDARFAERAAKRMDEFIGRSRILVLASHSEVLIRSSCNKAALMKAGRVLAVGTVDAIFEQYKEMLANAPP